MKLLHPFMPFVTEDMWQRLPRRQGDETESIMVSSFPEKASVPAILLPPTRALLPLPAPSPLLHITVSSREMRQEEREV